MLSALTEDFPHAPLRGKPPNPLLMRGRAIFDDFRRVRSIEPAVDLLRSFNNATRRQIAIRIGVILFDQYVTHCPVIQLINASLQPAIDAAVLCYKPKLH